MISIERLNNDAPKWSNSSCRVDHLVLALGKRSTIDVYQIPCQGRTKVINTSFMRVVYPLKYPSTSCLNCLDNGPLLL